MRRLNNNKKRIRRITIFLVVTFMLGFLEYNLVVDYNNANEANDLETINRYEEEYSILIDGYRTLSKAYYEEIINKDEVLSIMKEANTASESRKDELRLELADLLDDTYENMTDNHFRQVHFVLADNTSFYRFHYPSKYGDDLTEVRETVAIANSKKIYVEGFEEGKIFNGYRFERPLFIDGQHVGCVETSISFLTVIELMDKTFETPSVFILKKTVVEEKVFEELIAENYEESRVSDLYYYDKACSEYIDNTGRYYDVISILTNDSDKLKEINELIDKGETFVVDVKANNRTYSIVFLKIENVLGEQVGYLEFYNENVASELLQKGIIVKTMLIFILWLIIVIGIYVLARIRDKIEKISYQDKLTGAYNRYKLYNFIEEEIERNRRYDTNFSIVLYDIDYFKNINDKQGHMAGDLILKESVKLVAEKIRSIDKLFRFGGDEFIVLLPNTNLEEAKMAAENIREIIANTEYYYELKQTITFSMGVAQYKPGESETELISRADEMLYMAKNGGRNIVKG